MTSSWKIRVGTQEWDGWLRGNERDVTESIGCWTNCVTLALTSPMTLNLGFQWLIFKRPCFRNGRTDWRRTEGAQYRIQYWTHYETLNFALNHNLMTSNFFLRSWFWFQLYFRNGWSDWYEMDIDRQGVTLYNLSRLYFKKLYLFWFVDNETSWFELF